MHSEHRADDLRLTSYAFENGDQFLFYNMARLTPPEGTRLQLGDALKTVTEMEIENKAGLIAIQMAFLALSSQLAAVDDRK